MAQPQSGFLFDIRALELADHRGEFLGKVLAGAGADVVKVEPPGGSPTRRIGPFYQDQEHPERSLHFWHYNHGKRGVTLDVTRPEGQEVLKSLAPRFDVLIESLPPGYMESLGLGYQTLAAINPRLVMASITPFGQTGPRRDWKSSDLVHLALGGVMMNCGYDRTPEGEYDTPPIAPQMWHASHIVGNPTYIAIVAALLAREQTGRGQYIDAPMHQAVSTNTEVDVPAFVYNRAPVYRQTGRHAATRDTLPIQAVTRDGRYVLCSPGLGRTAANFIDVLAEHGAAQDLTDPKYQDRDYTSRPEVTAHIASVAREWVASHNFDRDLWREGQKHEFHWSPIRKPEENLADHNWRERKTFAQVRHEDIDRTLTYIGAPWLAEQCPWREGPRAPLLGEHNQEVFGKELGYSAAKLKALQKSKVM